MDVLTVLNRKHDYENFIDYYIFICNLLQVYSKNGPSLSLGE